ncbi:IPT/TIG domain-containing protein [Candidatus Margulisiibacteriota bacterium]
MIKKIWRSITLGVIASFALTALALPAVAGTPHTSYGIVSGGSLTDNWAMYVVARSSEQLTGTLAESAGQYFYQALVGNFPSPWANGDDSLAFISRELNAGANNHAGYYAVMNEDLSVTVNPQQYNDCTIRAIPTPTAAAGSGQVNLSWTAAATDTSETPQGNNISGYNVYRSTSQSSGFTQLNVSPVTGTSYNDTTGTTGTTYYYTIEPIFRGSIALGIYSANSNGIAFPAVAESVSVTSPNGGETWAPGSTHDITWTATGMTNVSIHYSVNGGTSWTAIIASTPNDGTHSWAIPGTIDSTECRIRVRDASDNTPSDMSDADFTIEAITTPTVTDISPISGAQAATALAVTITGVNTSWSGDMSGDVLFSGTGITLVSATAASATSIDAVIDIASDATLGGRTVTVTGAGGSATFTVTGGGSTDDFDIDLSAGAHVGQTIVLTGTGFGADRGTTPMTIGSVAAMPTEWSDTSITVAVPSGVSAGSVTVDVDGQTASLTVLSGGVVIDDVEGGSVGSWTIDNSDTDIDPDSGYYTYDEGVTPIDSEITANGPQAAARKHGARGMRVAYDGSTVTGWGGGWGAQLANSLDISAFTEIGLFIKWDGSLNSFKFALNDSAGHSYFASVSNATLIALSGEYAEIVLQISNFTEDVDNGDRTPGALDWSNIVSYNISYITTNASGSYQYIDSISARTVTWGDETDDGDDEITEVIVTEILPDRGPAGTKFTAIGEGFGISQGQSILVFENISSGITYNVNVLSWSDTAIEAIVPRLAPAGNYQLKVIKLAISAGNLRAYESNPEGFVVTGIMPAGGDAVVFPNPFNPLATEMAASGMAANQATIAYDATGVQNIGIYVYDSTARLVYQTLTTDTQVTWDGRDNGGSVVADGIYLLRIVNEDTKTLISKGKILVIKSN